MGNENYIGRIDENEDQEIDLRDRKLNEILEQPPNWVLTSGITVLYCILFLIVLGASLIKYPETRYASIKIEEFDRQHQLIAQSNGVIDFIFVHNNDKVKPYQTIAYYKNEANYYDVLKLRNWVDEYIEKQKSTNTAFVSSNYTLDLKLGRDLFKSYSNFLDKLLDLNNNLSHDVKRRSIDIALFSLKNDLENWMYNNTIRSRVDGTIHIPDWYVGKKINIGDTICSIKLDTPYMDTKYTGVIVLNYTDIAGVELGNKINIELFQYPPYNFGTLGGTIELIEYLNTEEEYLVLVDIPYPMRTTNKTLIDTNVALHGKAEIIMKEKSVLSILIRPIMSLIK